MLLDSAVVAFAAGDDVEAEAAVARMSALADGHDQLDLWPDTAAALRRARPQY